MAFGRREGAGLRCRSQVQERGHCLPYCPWLRALRLTLRFSSKFLLLVHLHLVLRLDHQQFAHQRRHHRLPRPTTPRPSCSSSRHFWLFQSSHLLSPFLFLGTRLKTQGKNNASSIPRCVTVGLRIITGGGEQYSRLKELTPRHTASIGTSAASHSTTSDVLSTKKLTGAHGVLMQLTAEVGSRPPVKSSGEC